VLGTAPIGVALIGDEFVSPALLQAATQDQLPDVAVDFRALSLPWPTTPFGPVAEVDEASGTEEQVIDALTGATIALTQMGPFTARVFSAAPQLRLVAVCRGGPVNVNLDAATKAGVAVSFAPGRNAQAAAEFAIGMMLAALRRIPSADAELARGAWRGDYYSYENSGDELAGSTVGLIGYGAIGRIVAQVLRAFGAEVLAADPFADADQAHRDGVRLVSLDELLASASVVSLHARLTAETRHLINAERLALLKPGAALVNTARGGLVDHDALAAALASGKVGAVALDVYDPEPPAADWPLLRDPRVVTTPHLAGASRQTARRAAQIAAGEVARFVRGEPLAHLANPAVLAG
jgi:D-3-phosphoglycerate dehydrogenase